MIVCEMCGTVDERYSKKSRFTIIFDPRFKNPDKLCICDDCLMNEYKKLRQTNNTLIEVNL